MKNFFPTSILSGFDEEMKIPHLITSAMPAKALHFLYDNDMKIIGIAGPTASGKTTVARQLEEHLGARRIKYSDILIDLARERGLDADDKATLQNLFLTEREVRGEDFLSRELEVRIASINAPYLVIEGNRRLADAAALRRFATLKKCPLLLLFIDASADTRFARYNRRLESSGAAAISRAAFDALEQNGAEDEIGALREMFTKDGMYIQTDVLEPEDVFTQISAYLNGKQ